MEFFINRRILKLRSLSALSVLLRRLTALSSSIGIGRSSLCALNRRMFRDRGNARYISRTSRDLVVSETTLTTLAGAILSCGQSVGAPLFA